jgi:hypothetical protein
MKPDHYARMSPRIRAKYIAILTRIYNDASRPEEVRRSAALRLARFRAAEKRPAVTTRAAAAPAPMPSKDQIFEAVEAFRSLGRQRSSLINKRKTAGEREILHTMIALMPPTVPEGSDPTTWRNFVSQIDGLLSQIKSIKNP